MPFVIPNIDTMRRTPVTSTTLRSVGYNEKDKILQLEFTSGEVYEYDKVPISTYKKLMKAGSLGRFFNDEIKDIYTFCQLKRKRY